jgi:general secretion pathway protein L
MAWSAAAAGFALFAAVSLGVAWNLDAKARDTYDESVKQFRRMFPDEHKIVNLRRQAERRLAAGTSRGGAGVRALATLAAAMATPELAGVVVKSLRFDATTGSLGAEVSSPDMARLDKLGQVLGGQGASARVLSASEENGVASARLELRSD